MLRKIILNSLYYSGIQKLFGRFFRGHGSILMLHRVQPGKHRGFCPNKHLVCSPQFLDRMILSLKRKGFEFASLDDMADRVANPASYKGRKPFLCITLDDGYRDNLEYAVPVFRRHEVPYAIYIAPGLVDGTATLWWEDLEKVIAQREHIFVEFPSGREDFDIKTVEQKRAAYQELADDLLFTETEKDQRQVITQLTRDYGFDAVAHVKNEIMDWAQINTLARDPLCTIGAHTIGHHALAKMTEKEARYEMAQSRKVIHTEIGQDPVHFAYPYGHEKLAASREFAIAKELGFKTAVTTRHGVVTKKHAEYITGLPRVSLNGNFQTIAYTKALISGLPARLMNRGKALNVRDVS